MIGFSIKYAFRARLAWTLLLMLLFSLSTFSYQTIAPTTDLVDRTFKAYRSYSSGFIIIQEDQHPKGATVSFYNPFDINGSIGKLAEEGKIDNVDYWIQKLERDTDLEQLYPFTPEKIQKVAHLSHVTSVYPMFCFESHYTVSENVTHINQVAVSVLAVDPNLAKVALTPFISMESGRFIAPSENVVVINQMLTREEIAVFEFYVDQEIPIAILDNEVKYRIVGVIGYGIPSKLIPGPGIVMNVDTLWSVLGVQETDRNYNVLGIQIDDPENAQQVISALREIFEGSSLSYMWQAQQAWASTQLLESTAPLYKIIKYLLVTFTSLTIFLASLIKVNRSRRDIGLLVSLGWLERDIVKHLLTGSITEGVAGVILGAALTQMVGSRLAARLVPQSLRGVYMIYPQIPDPRYLAHAPALTLGFILLSSSAIYWYIRRYTPLEMLREK